MKAFRLTDRLLSTRWPVAGVLVPGVPDDAESLRAKGWARHEPHGAQQAGAVVVPWRVVHRSESGVLEVEHRGEAPLRAVRFSLAGDGLLGLTLPRTVYPGERVRVVLRGVFADGALTSPDALLVLRWFEADGTELLWPIAL